MLSDGHLLHSLLCYLPDTMFEELIEYPFLVIRNGRECAALWCFKFPYRIVDRASAMPQSGTDLNNVAASAPLAVSLWKVPGLHLHGGGKGLCYPRHNNKSLGRDCTVEVEAGCNTDWPYPSHTGLHCWMAS